ncbi:complement factor H-like isoform X3 [Bubalus bubalis]|uniref:complement factor H-like isoform X3 n=1 Tax=Bubalus bubalis TaxID=89462 RepID=UPI001E1B74C7|nr:complement factor H-like isoform X3 [Bubalus bubalis]
MRLLINVLLTLWFYTAHGQGKHCNYPVIKHGRLYQSYSGYFPARVNQQFLYNCDQYFVPPSQYSSDYLTCTEEGWSPEEPCLRECIFNNLENGYTPSSEKKAVQGETVRVRCYHGYSLQNNQNTMTCTESGWSPPPRCIRVNTNCVNLPTFEDAVLIDREKNFYRSGEQVAFKCLSYYQLDGSNTIQCVKSKWIGRPACRDVSCVNPPQVENAIIHNQKSKYQSGERARYECIGNYDLFGEIEVVCLNGTWTEPPQCKDSQGKCGPPPPIDNGDITSLLQSAYPSGMSVEYRCQAYYELRGNKNVVCRNGEWTQPPKCLEACLISEETMRKHHIQLRWKYEKKLYSKTEDTIEFMCQYGYRQLTPKHTFRTTCREGNVVYPRCG